MSVYVSVVSDQLLSLQAMQDKVQALVRLSEAERSHQRSSIQLDNLKKQNQDLTQRLRDATQEKVNALMRVAADSNSGLAAGNGKGVPSPQKTSTWKVRHCAHGVWYKARSGCMQAIALMSYSCLLAALAWQKAGALSKHTLALRACCEALQCSQ